MIRTFIVPLIAIVGVLAAVITVVQGSKPPPAQPPVIEPPRTPYESFVAGSGLVEASTQNLAIGAPVGAIVTAVPVTVGDGVSRGDTLFELDSRDLAAELGVREAGLLVAAENLTRLKAGTRPELIPPARARVAESEASVGDFEAQLAMLTNLSDARAVSAEEQSRRRFAVSVAHARADQARADLALLEAGSWARDISVAEAEVALARAQADAIRVEIDRRTVRSPIDGRVLQVNIRAGEYAPSGVPTTPLVLVGSVSPLHVRVDVDEHESWRVEPGSPAVAFVRGNKDITTTLMFVRFEPYIVPKKSLTGDSTERVDTRVLQVIYSFEPRGLPVFVGQQMDVFIKAKPGLSHTAPAPAGAAAEENQR